MTHDELLAKIDSFIFDEGDGVHIGFVDAFDALQALCAIVKLCNRGGYTTWDKSMVPMIDGVYEEASAKKWEAVHGHDIRLKCYAEFGCQLLLDPQQIVQAIEDELK